MEPEALPQCRHVLMVPAGLVEDEHRYLLEAQFVEYQTVQPVVLTEAARTAGGRHEEGGAGGIEVRRHGLLDDIAGGDDAGIALLTRRISTPYFQSKFVRFWQRLGIDAAVTHGGSQGKAVIDHIGYVNAPALVVVRGYADQRNRLANAAGTSVTDGIDEGLAPRDYAGIGGVLVDFYSEERLAFYLLAEEFEQIRIRSLVYLRRKHRPKSRYRII